MDISLKLQSAVGALVCAAGSVNTVEADFCQETKRTIKTTSQGDTQSDIQMFYFDLSQFSFRSVNECQ